MRMVYGTHLQKLLFVKNAPIFCVCVCVESSEMINLILIQKTFGSVHVFTPILGVRRANNIIKICIKTLITHRSTSDYGNAIRARTHTHTQYHNIRCRLLIILKHLPLRQHYLLVFYDLISFSKQLIRGSFS